MNGIGPTVEEQLIEAAHTAFDKDPKVRLEGLRTLATIHDERTVPLLLLFTKDEDEAVTLLAARSLLELCRYDQSLEEGQSKLSSSEVIGHNYFGEDETHDLINQAVFCFRDEAALNYVIDVLSYARGTMAVLGIRSLARGHNADKRPGVLKEFLSDTDPEIRAAAVKAYGQLVREALMSLRQAFSERLDFDVYDGMRAELEAIAKEIKKFVNGLG